MKRTDVLHKTLESLVASVSGLTLRENSSAPSASAPLPFVFKNFPISNEENFNELENELKEVSVKEAFVSNYWNHNLHWLLQSFYSTPSQIHQAVLRGGGTVKNVISNIMSWCLAGKFANTYTYQGRGLGKKKFEGTELNAAILGWSFNISNSRYLLSSNVTILKQPQFASASMHIRTTSTLKWPVGGWLRPKTRWKKWQCKKNRILLYYVIYLCIFYVCICLHQIYVLSDIKSISFVYLHTTY